MLFSYATTVQNHTFFSCEMRRFNRANLSSSQKRGWSCSARKRHYENLFWMFCQSGAKLGLLSTLPDTRLIESCATVVRPDFCLNSVAIDVCKFKVDWNELSLHGVKMKPEIKLSFALNLSSRHNLERLRTFGFGYLLFHLLNPSILLLMISESVYLKVAQKIRWSNHQPCFNLNSIFFQLPLLLKVMML